MKRILILIAAPALLACAGRASAGQYEVHGCRTPAGAALPALGWLGSYGPGPWFLSDDTCARGGRLEAALMKVAGYEHPQGAHSQWRFRAPEGTSIRRVRGDVAMRTSRERPYASPVAGGRADDGQGRFGIQSGAVRGSLDAPAAPGNAFDTGVMSPTAAYTLLAACSGGGGACPEAAAGDPAVATVRVFRTQVTLEDLTPPALDSEPRGTLTAPGVHRGIEGVSVAARDLGSGVRRLVAELDGRERASVRPRPERGPVPRAPRRSRARLRCAGSMRARGLGRRHARHADAARGRACPAALGGGRRGQPPAGGGPDRAVRRGQRSGARGARARSGRPERERHGPARHRPALLPRPAAPALLRQGAQGAGLLPARSSVSSSAAALP